MSETLEVLAFLEGGRWLAFEATSVLDVAMVDHDDGAEVLDASRIVAGVDGAPAEGHRYRLRIRGTARPVAVRSALKLRRVERRQVLRLPPRLWSGQSALEALVAIDDEPPVWLVDVSGLHRLAGEPPSSGGGAAP